MFSFLSQFFKLRKLQSEHTHKQNKQVRISTVSQLCTWCASSELVLRHARTHTFCVTLEHSFTHTVTLRRSANELVDRHVMRMERFALKFLEHDILRKHTRELIKRNEETLLIHWIDSVLELIDHKTLNCAVRGVRSCFWIISSCFTSHSTCYEKMYSNTHTHTHTDRTNDSSRCFRVFQFLS